MDLDNWEEEKDKKRKLKQSMPPCHKKMFEEIFENIVMGAALL